MVRRSPVNRPENALALALAEIERLKGITSRITDGRQIVIIPGDRTGAASGGGDSDTLGGGIPPVSTSGHVLYGAKHTRSFRVTESEGVSLVIFYEEGQIWVGGTFYSVDAGTLMMADAATNYVFVNAAGVVASNTASFPADSAPLAVVVAAGGDITSVNDRRSYLSTGGAVVGSLHDADQIIDDDSDTSVEVERGADDDTIRLKAMSVDVALITSAGLWQLPVPGSGAGISLGADVHLYRAAADLLALAAGDNLNLVQGYIQLEDMATPAVPAFGDMHFFTRISGSRIQLIGQGPTGEECVICDVSNVAAAANILTLNWIE